MRYAMIAFVAALTISVSTADAEAGRRSRNYRTYRSSGYQTTTTYSRPQRTGIFATLMRIERAKNQMIFGR